MPNHESVLLTRFPSVAVIVPAYNEEKYIAGCLKSLLAQDYNSSLVDIIVADNGSTDSTLEIANDLGVRTCVVPDVKVGQVRNFGVNQSSAEVLAFIDSDCLAPCNWLSSGVSALISNPDLGALGGGYVAPENGSWMEKAWAGNGSVVARSTNSLVGGNFFITRRLFLKLGGFDGSLSAGEDDEFSHRILQDGKSLLETPECAVVHLGWPKSLLQVFRRQVWQGSNQIEAAGRANFLGLLLVHIFALSVIATLGLAIPMQSRELLGLCMLPLALIPGVAAFKKGMANPISRFSLILFCRLYLIFFVYYLGRTVGLILNYYSRLTRHSIKIYK